MSNELAHLAYRSGDFDCFLGISNVLVIASCQQPTVVLKREQVLGGQLQRFFKIFRGLSYCFSNW